MLLPTVHTGSLFGDHILRNAGLILHSRQDILLAGPLVSVLAVVNSSFALSPSFSLVMGVPSHLVSWMMSFVCACVCVYVALVGGTITKNKISQSRKTSPQGEEKENSFTTD